MRKFVIGFVSLCVVLGAYLLYNRISGSPSIDTDRQVDIIESAADANAVDFDGEIGKITKKLQKIYNDIIRGNNPKYISWCTPAYKESPVAEK